MCVKALTTQQAGGDVWCVLQVAGMFFYNVVMSKCIPFNGIALWAEINSFFLHSRKLLQLFNVNSILSTERIVYYAQFPAILAFPVSVRPLGVPRRVAAQPRVVRAVPLPVARLHLLRHVDDGAPRAVRLPAPPLPLLLRHGRHQLRALLAPLQERHPQAVPPALALISEQDEAESGGSEREE